MANEFDWDSFEDAPEPVQFNWDQFQDNGQQQPELSGMENFYRASGIHGANRAFSSLFGFGPHTENTQQAYEQARETHPMATDIGYGVGQAAGMLPFLAAGTAAAPGVAGAAIGAGAYGAQNQPQEGETRLGNALYDALFATGLGAAGAGASKSKDLIKKIPYSKTKIANNINNAFTGAKGRYNSLYDSLFQKVEQEGIKTNLPGKDIPKRALNKIINKATQGIDAQTMKPVKKAFKTNNPKDVHEAKSKVSEYIRNENKIKRAGGRIDNDAMAKAKSLKKDLNKELNDALKANNIELADEYKNITKGYKKDVVPYSRNPAIQEFNVGDSVPKDLVKALRGGGKSGKLFRAHLAEQHPEVRSNQLLENGLKLGLGGYGGYKAYDYLFNK